MSTANGKAKATIRHCVDCGRKRGAECPLNINGRCIECGLKAAAEAARQMQAKSGPYYEKFMARRWWRGESVRIPPGAGAG